MIRLHEQAAGEIEQAVAWYERQAPGVGRRFREEIAHAYKVIGNAPERWAVCPGFEEEPAVRRYFLRKFPYTLVYIILDDSILLLAAAHQNRRPNYWTLRLPSAGG